MRDLMDPRTVAPDVVAAQRGRVPRQAGPLPEPDDGGDRLQRRDLVVHRMELVHRLRRHRRAVTGLA
ncbi:MAG: hypothetical protein ACLGIV_05830 [Actinomycetes bacterium]